MTEKKIPEGYKKTEIGVIPEDWEVKKLKEVRNTLDNWSYTGGPFGSDLQTKHYTESGVRIIQLQNIGKGRFIDNVRIYTNENKADELKACNVYPGDIIMSKMGDPVARACLVPEGQDRYLMCSDGIRLQVDTKSYNTSFIHDFINSAFFLSQASNASTGSTRLRIGLKQLANLPIPIPPKKEQTAIAEALSDIDELIQSLDKLIAKKRDIKLATMQQLLTGKTRLPGFSGEWEEKRLGDVISLKSGYSFKSENFQDFGLPVIRIANLKNGTVEPDHSVCHPVLKISDEFIVKKDDILIAMSGATTGKIGIYKKSYPSFLNQRVGKFVCDYRIVRDTFIFGFLSSYIFKTQLSVFLEQGAQPNISAKQIESFSFLLPSIKEQTAIAEILSDMDSEIEALEKRRDKTIAIKQGMMQVLLTGRVRLVGK
ncbi:MAG: restriction endonuclease subunit S [Candidatus Zixiibacteriota bacterium]